MSEKQSSVREFGCLPETEQVTFNPDASVRVGYGDVLNFYDDWPTPDIIIADGPSATEVTAETSVQDWYEPHIEAWADAAPSGSSLWFWTTNKTWADLRGLFREYGWRLQSLNTWVKGVEAASDSVRWQYPDTTAVCAYYVRGPYVTVNSIEVPASVWLEAEWQAAGLDVADANDAVDPGDIDGEVFVSGESPEWRPPMPSEFEQIVEYATDADTPAREDARSVFELTPGDGPVTASEWADLLPSITVDVDWTDVWECDPPSGEERCTTPSGENPSQKPLKLMRHIVHVASDQDDVVWEPFGGFCSGAVAAKLLGRRAVAAEHRREVFDVAQERLQDTQFGRSIDGSQQGLDSFTSGE